MWDGVCTFPELLGVTFVEAGPEHVTATLLVRPELCTVGGTLHGGTVMALADTLGAVATVLNLSGGARTVTQTQLVREPEPPGG